MTLTVDRGSVQLAREYIDVREMVSAWVDGIIRSEPKRTLSVYCQLGQHSWDIEVPESVLAAYGDSSSPHIQVLWPESTPAEREGLMTGTCSECWDKYLGDDE